MKYSLLFLIIINFSSVTMNSFTDPLGISYEDAWTLALENSDELDFAAVGMVLAKQKTDTIIRSYLPHISFGYNDTNSVIVNGNDTKKHQLSITVQQMIYDGGQTAFGKEMSMLQLQMQATQVDAKKLEMRDSVWELYYSILILQEKIAIQKENYKLAVDQVAIAKTQLELGAIREIDYIETELEITSLDQSITETEFQLDDALYDFKRLSGLEADNEIILTDTINTGYNGTDLLITANDLYTLALIANSEIENFDIQLHQKFMEKQFMTRTWIPQISGEFSFQVSGDSLPLGSPSFSASISLAFPDKLFPFSTKGTVSSSRNSASLSGNSQLAAAEDFTTPISKAETDTAIRAIELKKDLYLNNLLTEIERSLRAYENMKKRILLQRTAQELQKKKLFVMEKQFELGEIISLDLLKTRNQLISDEISLIEQVMNILQAERGLEKIAGLAPGQLMVIQNELQNLGINNELNQ